MVLLLTILVGLTLLLICRKVFAPGRWKGNVPPSVPGTHLILGDLRTIGKSRHVHQAFQSIAKQVGPVFKLRLLHKETVILSSHAVIKEAHNNPLLDKRPNNILSRLYCGPLNKKGIIFNATEEWKTLRRFSLKALRNFGFGKTNVEDGILEECQMLINYFESEGSDQAEVEISTIFNKVALNIVWRMAAGERYEYDDSRLDRLITMLDKFTNLVQVLLTGPLELLPFLKHIPPFKADFLNAQKGMEELRLFLRETIEDHKKTFDAENIRDYIDTFINEIEISEDKTFCEEHLVICCLDLFAAGSETASKSLMFIFAYMVLYPEVQEKVFQELIAQVPDGPVKLEDISALTFTNSVMNEIWRLNPILPLDAQRETLGDVNIGGFDIPAGTEIISNYSAAQRDENVWDEPNVFKPERHLGQKENLLLFGTGRRKCMGEGLARAGNCLIFCNLIKNFTFGCVEGKKPDVEYSNIEPSFTVGPKAFNVIVTPRH